MSQIVIMPRRAGKSWVSRLMRGRKPKLRGTDATLVIVDDLAADDLAVEAIREKLKGHKPQSRSVYTDDVGYTTHNDTKDR